MRLSTLDSDSLRRIGVSEELGEKVKGILRDVREREDELTIHTWLILEANNEGRSVSEHSREAWAIWDPIIHSGTISTTGWLNHLHGGLTTG